MHIYDHFPYTGKEQRWSVPQGVTEALFECWGAAGGMSSDLSHTGKKGEVVGGPGPRNDSFYNNPNSQGQLGTSFANNAGYAAGIRAVDEGDVFYVYVGGNGGPGHSSIKQKQNGDIEVNTRGGAGGFNGGGDGGEGARTFQNLYNSKSTNYHYKSATMPNSAKNGQLWLDTSGSNTLKKCNNTYTAGNGSAAKWDKVTNDHDDLVGPSGGGGGGATDIRHGTNDLNGRILVAGGGGGSVGPWVKSGKASWTLSRVPDTPSPPFGTDDTSTGATGPDQTWTTAVNYFTGGWGGGGMGGGTGPRPGLSPALGGGVATTGDAGGPATDRHKDGDAPDPVNGSGGKGGSALVGGDRGKGGSGGQDGSKGLGGNGADAAGGNDDFCAGGGGGGGGWFGGGGGGMGFKVTGDNSDVRTRGGGGGGGSNYADDVFSQFILNGAAQPPFAKGNSGTGSNGLGGFARISYHVPPTVVWTSAPSTAIEDDPFDISFVFRPGRSGGSGIAYFQIGTASDPDATFPTSQSTIMVTDPSTTDFTYSAFVGPTAGDTAAFFVKVVDVDGDGSTWLKQKVTGLASTDTDPATITSPASGDQFIDDATVTWAVGTQTPLVGYRLGLTGDQLATGAPYSQDSGWRRGGSRVNLALDPGFNGTAYWSSDDNTDMTSQTTHPGVSGKSGLIAWALADDGTAEQHTTTHDNFRPGTTYRLHLEVTSAVDDDPRPVEVQVWDETGMLTSYAVDFDGNTAGTLLAFDMPFTPQGQGVYFKVVPSGSPTDGSEAYFEGFEAGAGGWTAAAGFTVSQSPTQAFAGDDSLKVHGHVAGGARAASLDITSLMTALGLGAGWYTYWGYGYAPAAADHNAVLRVNGAGVVGGEQIAVGSVRDAMTLLRVPFQWDGAGAVTLYVDGYSGVDGDMWYDNLSVTAFSDASDPAYGNADQGQQTFLANMLVELVYEEDSAGYGAYFDGAHANGTGLTTSWAGTTNASPSFGTGVDATSGDLAYTGAPLSNGEVTLDTLTEGALVSGYAGARATQSVKINPSLPALPTVTLTVNSAAGVMVLGIDAADGAATDKTVSFDIFRNGVRIATGLVPDHTTRLASFTDVPAHGEAATYLVRAFDSSGGYRDQTDGTVA